MRSILAAFGRILFALGIVASLAFGVHEAAGLGPDRSFLCEGTCPNQQACELCCIDAGGSGGACVNPEDCICIA